MTITIDLAPEEEARLRKRAALKGQDLDRFVRTVVEREASQEPEVTLDVALAGLLAEAEALEPVPPRPGSKGAVAEMIATKFRRQGFNV